MSLASSSPAPSLARKRPRGERVALAPLIDVVLILLFFFVLTTSFLEFRNLSLAAAGPAGDAPSVEGAFLIDLRADGLRLGGAPIEEAALDARLAERLARKPDQRVLVRPASGVDVQRTVALLDRLAALGVADVALMAPR